MRTFLNIVATISILCSFCYLLVLLYWIGQFGYQFSPATVTMTNQLIIVVSVLFITGMISALVLAVTKKPTKK